MTSEGLATLRDWPSRGGGAGSRREETSPARPSPGTCFTGRALPGRLSACPNHPRARRPTPQTAPAPHPASLSLPWGLQPPLPPAVACRRLPTSSAGPGAARRGVAGGARSFRGLRAQQPPFQPRPSGPARLPHPRTPAGAPAAPDPAPRPPARSGPVTCDHSCVPPASGPGGSGRPLLPPGVYVPGPFSAPQAWPTPGPRLQGCLPIRLLSQGV